MKLLVAHIILCPVTIIVNSELGGMGMTAVMVYFELICWHMPGRTEENHKIPQISLCPVRDLYYAPPIYCI